MNAIDELDITFAELGVTEVRMVSREHGWRSYVVVNGTTYIGTALRPGNSLINALRCAKAGQ
jgi:hypothetical protein